MFTGFKFHVVENKQGTRSLDPTQNLISNDYRHHGMKINLNKITGKCVTGILSDFIEGTRVQIHLKILFSNFLFIHLKAKVGYVILPCKNCTRPANLSDHKSVFCNSKKCIFHTKSVFYK